MTKPAEFPISLNLPTGDDQDLQNAAHAIREEYRGTTRWKRLKVSPTGTMRRPSVPLRISSIRLFI